jgi:hypothetical protein
LKTSGQGEHGGGFVVGTGHGEELVLPEHANDATDVQSMAPEHIAHGSVLVAGRQLASTWR